MTVDFLKDMLNFNQMLSPLLIRVLYYVGLSLIGLYSLVLIAGGFNMPNGLGAGITLMGVLYLLIGPIVLRIFCELGLAIFAINENSGEIRKGYGYLRRDRAA